MNTLPLIDDEYPTELTEAKCATCDDLGGFWHHGNFKKCPVCRGEVKEDHDES